MPLQIAKGPNYVKVTKVFVNSDDRDTGSPGPYDYVITLPKEIQYVVGIELTSYNFPSEIAPTFVAAGTGFDGTNKLDFALSNGTATNFTMTWPEKSYSYQNVTVPYLSYVRMLQQLLNETIFSDATFGNGGPNEATFSVTVDPEERTVVTVSGTGVTGFQFLFATGTNEKDSAHTAMGYTKADTALALTNTSPNPTNLSPFRFIDVNVEEAAEYQPLSRVYMTDNVYYGTVRNEPNVTRTRLLSSQPIHRLKRLRIKLTLEGGVVPPVTSGLSHDLGFTVFNLANEDVVPAWVKQTFTL
jgi:hypothetical protein